MKRKRPLTARHAVGAIVAGITAFYDKIIMHLLDTPRGTQNMQHMVLLALRQRVSHDVNMVVDHRDEVIEGVGVLGTEQARLDLRGNPGVLRFLARRIRAPHKEFVVNLLNAFRATRKVENLLAFGLRGHHAGEQHAAVKDIDTHVHKVIATGLGQGVLDAQLRFGIRSDLLRGAVLQPDITGRGRASDDERGGAPRQQRGHDQRGGKGGGTERDFQHQAHFLVGRW